MSTSTKTTTTSSGSKCSTTAPAPTCEYGCGSWCSKPLPWFSDLPGCKAAAANCALQVADCMSTTGWPGALQCFTFASWCQSISNYASSVCSSGSCSKSDCLSKNPPQNPPATTAGVCISTATTTASSSALPSTVTNVCALPTGSANSGYASGQCVGNVLPPFVTCNDIQSDWAQNPFKVYSSKDSASCASYSRGQVSSACQAACKTQYSNCMSVYAAACKTQPNSLCAETYSNAAWKCSNQQNDCVSANRNVYVSGSRCASFGSGWS
ncbi:hypothetical protein MMC13_007605 [Lambiella insularis]|nr:hypothetical protein [Lambiella insularis]